MASTFVVRFMHICPCADPESFVRGGPIEGVTTYFCYFLVIRSKDEGEKDPYTTISEPSTACGPIGGGPMMAQH